MIKDEAGANGLGEKENGVELMVTLVVATYRPHAR
jgi:hypothetical protein